MIETSPSKPKAQNYYAHPKDVVYLRRSPSACGNFWIFELMTEEAGLVFVVYSCHTYDIAMAMAKAYGLEAVLLN